MQTLKHVGRTKQGKKKCGVAYRVVPGEPENCLVVFSESLDAPDHDAMITLIESNAGQTAYELADAMARTRLPDGRNMLNTFHRTGKLIKVPTNTIEMTPNSNTTVDLDELNQHIAEQQGKTVNDLAVKSPEGETLGTAETIVDPVAPYTETTTAGQPDVLTDEALAAQYRSQADSLFKEAKRLREQAEDLVPTKRKSKTTADG